MIQRLLVFACVVVLCLSGGAQAKIMGVGLSAFYGVNIPLVQDDAESGPVYGLRAPLQMMGALRVEPWFSMATIGDYDLVTPISGTTTFPGGDITSFGLNALLGSPFTSPGFSIAFLGGIGSHKMEREGADADTRVGYNVGLDMGIGLGSLPLSLSARGEGLVIPLDGGGSRKSAMVTGALTYKFGL